MRIDRFGYSFVLTAVAVYFSYNILSLLLDPYNVVWRAHSRYYGGLVLDQFRFAKTERLLLHPSRYDTLILGNSRGSDNMTRALSEATGLRIFNYSVSSDYPLGYLMKLRWLTRTQHSMKNVVLLLWIDQFWMAGTNDGPLLAREHPAISGESWWRYYLDFSKLPYATFFQVASFHIKRSVGLAQERNLAVVKDSGIDIESGDFDMWDIFEKLDVEDRGLTANQRSIVNEPSGALHFRANAMTSIEQKALAKSFSSSRVQDIQLSSFNAAIDFLKANRIRYYCVVPPMNARVVSWVPIEKYLDEWMKLVLDRCGEVWDFSKPSSVTRDPHNYFDWNDYVPSVAYKMLAGVLHNDVPSNFIDPAAFGSHVTPATFGTFAAQFRDALALSDKRARSLSDALP